MAQVVEILPQWSQCVNYVVNTMAADGLETQGTWGGGYKANFLPSVIFLIFQHRQNTC